jgi:adenosylcobinamide-GDP ribazoletransferase
VTPLRDTLNLFARRFVLALQTSTRVRATGGLAPPAAPEADLLHASTAHVPGAGWLVGIAACLAFAVVSLALRDNPWGPAVAAVACTIATVILTGAIYEGALFRIAGSLEGQPAGAAAASGTGVLALVLLLPAKFALLAALASASEPAVMAALFAGHVVSRFALVVTHWAGSTDADTRSLRVGALWCVVPLLLMVPAGGLAFLLLPLAFGSLAAFGVLRFLRSQPEAPAAERPGVVQQVAEVAFYFGAAIAA